MDPIAIGIISIVVLFILLFLGMHIGFALALVGVVGYAIIAGLQPSLALAGRVPYNTLANYTFSLFPLFLLMGEFASNSGMMGDAYYAVNTWIGHWRGGLAAATIGACGAFSGVCGSSQATAATMTRVALPEMIKYKYAPSLAAGSIAAGGTLGILIPPSTAFVFYGMMTQQSIGKLLTAGILPGILKIALYVTVIFIVCARNPALGPPGPRFSWKQRFMSLNGIWAIGILFLVVMGGIWTGIFTATEAGSIGVLGTFLIGFIGRRIKRRNIIPTFIEALTTSGMAFVLMAGAILFTYLVTISRMAVALALFIGSLSIPPLGVLVVIILVYLVLGCIMDSLSMTLVTVPIFAPIVSALGYDLIWFGVIVVVMIEVAMITPPLASNVFLIAGMAPHIPMYTIFKGIIPFLVADGFLVVFLVAFPQISLVLPNAMMTMR